MMSPTLNNNGQQLEDLQERADGVASSLGFENFEELADWLNKRDTLSNRLGLVQPSPILLSSSSSAKKKRHSDIGTEKKRSDRTDAFSVEDSPLTGKGNTEELETEIGSSRRRKILLPVNESPPTAQNLAENEQRGQSSTELLQKRLDLLQEKYDALVKAKVTAEEKYKADDKKWKKVKGIFLEQLVRERERNSPSSSSMRRTLTRHKSLEDNAASRSFNHMKRIFGAHAATAQDGQECLSPRSSKMTEQATPRHGQELSSDGISSSLAITVMSEPKTMSISGVTRRGRYNRDQDGQTTINAEFEINRETNGGVTYQFDEVVRDRSRRQRLHAGDCDCCKNYYDLVKPVPARSGLMWRSPTPIRVRKPQTDTGPSTSNAISHPNSRPVHDADFSPFASPVRALQADTHKQLISRHRHVWAPPATPPDYWTIEFPDTQRAADINRKAADMHRDKRRRIARDANSKNGRFVRRDKDQ